MAQGRIQLSVASPCTESWEKMEGDERVRFCARCKLNVYNLSEHTIGELEALMERTEGRLCGRLYRRDDGTALTRDCPVGLRRARMRMAAAVATAVGLVGALILGSPARASADTVPFTLRVEEWKQRARYLPVIGNLLRLIDPQPVMGAMVALPPSSSTHPGL